MRRRRLRRPFLPDGAGERHRQPDPPGDQALCEPAHRAHDERARRRRRHRPAAARDHARPGGRPAARYDVPHRERAPYRGRGARPPRVRADAALRKRMTFHPPARTTAPMKALRTTARTTTLVSTFALAILAAGFEPAAYAEMSEIHVSRQYGISYLPLMVMEDQKLIEKHAKASGVDVKVDWSKFAGGNVMNDALLSGTLQFASGGVAPFTTLWAKTRGNLDVKAVSALNSMPLYLVTNNPKVKTIKDFTDQDKIAL